MKHNISGDIWIFDNLICKIFPREKKNAFRFIDLKMDNYGFPAILQRDLQKLEIDF
jgi:hypothetical protein